MIQIITGVILGSSSTIFLQTLYKHTQIQPNKSYSGKRFVKINSKDYYRISSKLFINNINKDNSSQSYFTFYEKNDFIKLMPELNNYHEVHKLIITEKTSKIYVNHNLSVSIDSNNMDYKIIDPYIEFYDSKN